MNFNVFVKEILMESLNSHNTIENLNLLEEKLASLVELVKQLRLKNNELEKEKLELEGRLERLEEELLRDSEGMEELHQERALTKQVVDDLIKSIDSLVKPEVKPEFQPEQ